MLVRKYHKWFLIVCFWVPLLIGTNIIAKSNEDFAKELANPIASLTSVPFQLNYDADIGPADEGKRYLLNVQPVIPVSINKDWNMISRTILPVIKQDNVVADSGSDTGLGDVVQSVFFSPVKLTETGWIWGAGPVLLLPTATDELLGAEKWGIGPTAVGLKQDGPWTYGALANHIWSVAGESNRSDISATFLQPFLSYTTEEAMTFALNTESTYDWEARQWAVPVNFIASKVVGVGGQLVSVGAGLRYWAENTDNGPEGLGARLIITLLFPK